MKKTLLLFTIISLSTFATKAQDYLGLSTGNYSGLHGLMLQPANIADNRYKFDLNLFSTNISFQNNYLGFSRKFFVKNRFSFKDYDTYDEFKKNVITEKGVSGKPVQFNLNNRLNLPSVMFSTGKKSGIALGLQSRTSLAVSDMNADFAKQLYEEWKYPQGYGDTMRLNGMDMSALNWFEGSITYGRVLLDKEKHFLKAGVTAKYLGGVSAWYLHADDLDVVANNDSTLSMYGNQVRYGHSKTNINSSTGTDYRPDASGLGFDAGIVYEFRGRIDKFKFMKVNKKKESVQAVQRRDKNKYSFKLGVSLVDVGQLTFNSTSLARDFSTNVNGINIRNANIKNVQTLDTFISNNVSYLPGDSNKKFSVAMPTALSAQVDLHLVRGFYVNAMAYMPFKGLNKDADYRTFTPNYYAVTPRWESRMAGLYVPLVYNNNYNDDKTFSIGSTVRLGPLFVGTSNVLSLFKQEDIQSADLHLGFKVPVGHGKPSKSARWFKNFTSDELETEDAILQTDEIQRDTIVEIEEKVIIEEKKTKEKKSKKKEDKEEKQDVRPIQIIINNYSSSSKSNPSEQRVINVDPLTGVVNEQTLNQNSETDNDETVISNSNSSDQELDYMQKQIEYLKFKLKQKEELLDELTKEQERIKNNSSNEESKKKIDSLTDEYLYNNNFVWNGATYSDSSSVLSSETRLYELRKEILDLDNRNSKLETKMAEIKTVNENLQNSVVDTSRLESIKSLDVLMNDMQEKEYLTLKPSKTYYQLPPGYNYETQQLPAVVSPQTTTQSHKIVKGETTNSKSIDANTRNHIEKINKSYKKEYEALRNELKYLRADLKKYNREAKRNAAKKNVTWVPYDGKPSNDQTKAKNASSQQGVTIVRDTIYIEKPVDRVVTKIVRDTITNTIEKNNIITKTKIEKVEVDNTEQRLLDLPAYFVLFDVNSASVKKIYRNKLDYYAMQLNKYPALNVKLTGHADATGNPQKNLALSEARARQVRNYLIQKGVNRDRISMDFNGDKDPLADNQTNSGKSQNRRVEILFVE